MSGEKKVGYSKLTGIALIIIAISTYIFQTIKAAPIETIMPIKLSDKEVRESYLSEQSSCYIFNVNNLDCKAYEYNFKCWVEHYENGILKEKSVILNNPLVTEKSNGLRIVLKIDNIASDIKCSIYNEKDFIKGSTIKGVPNLARGVSMVLKDKKTIDYDSINLVVNAYGEEKSAVEDDVFNGDKKSLENLLKNDSVNIIKCSIVKHTKA